MGWFNRSQEGINTKAEDKKEIKEGLWYKCPQCKKIITTDDLKERFGVCECGYHERISTQEYFKLLFDNNIYTEFDAELRTSDPLNFVDKKKYTDRIKSVCKSTGMNESMTSAEGNIDGIPAAICSMNFEFIGGSMGSVAGEKIARAVDRCIQKRMPLIILSKSGGARMMEGAFSLMQMAKTSAKLTQLSDAKLPYISVMLDPTTGGVSASYAFLGDVNIAEPGALICFAGPRVIRETIGRDLPEGFQRAEFLLEHGFLDCIAERKNLKSTISGLLKKMM